jgi:hypothetical protein
MKRIFYVLLCLSILAACKNKPEESEGAVDANGRPLDETPGLIHQFKPLINGVWVKKDYIKKLIRSRSPLEAAPKATGLTTFFIDTGKLTGDSIVVPAGWNNHEGSEITLRFKPGKNTTTIQLGDDELSYSLKNGDTTLIVYHYDPKSKETSTSKYIKALNKQPAGQLGYGMNLMINQGIISGTYEATDDAGKKFNVVFKDDGKVLGFPGANTYQIQNDLGGGPMNNLDAIFFQKDGKIQKRYTFDIGRRKVELYETKANADSSELVRDKLVYKLKRRK